MNITYIIGNGFDLNLGLRTDYPSFCKHYLAATSKNDLIKNFKNDIEKDLPNWSDLEIALGDYTGKCTTSEEFLNKYDDMYDALIYYLEDIDNNSKIRIEKVPEDFFKDLISPEQYLNPNLREIIFNDKQSRINSTTGQDKVIINIITLNYTFFFEKLISGLKDRRVSINGLNPYKIGSICHVHGSLDTEDVQFGVNDDTQVANKEFSKVVSFNNTFVKPVANKFNGSLNDVKATDIIGSSDLICIFGASCGITDRIWWNKVLELLSRKMLHVIWFYRENRNGVLSPSMKKHLGIKGYDLAKKICSENGHENIANNLALNSIHVALNTKMFSSLHNAFEMPTNQKKAEDTSVNEQEPDIK